MERRSAAFLISVIFLSSAVAGAWSINDNDSPVSHDVLSEDTDTKQVVELVDSNGNPVDLEELQTAGYDFNFIYNRTGGSASMEADMKHLASGYYYADFQANFTDGMIEYELEGTSPEINSTENIPVGNHTVSIQNDFSVKYKAGSEIEVGVRLEDEWNDTIEDRANVELHFTNGTWTSSPVQLGYNSRKELYTNGVTLPRQAEGTYVVHVDSYSTGAAYENARGSHSVILETHQSVQGETLYLNASSGCNNETYFTACERGASIETGYNVTASSANRVELDLLLVNRSNGEWVERDSLSMSEESGLWEASFEFPDIDTSWYRKKLVLRYNATNGKRSDVDTRNISYRTYRIQDRSSPAAYQGSDYEVELFFAKYFSLESLNRTRFDNASITVEGPGDSELISFNMNEMSFRRSTGLFKNTIQIPSDATSGAYETAVTAFNRYGERKTLSSGFNVRDIQATFNTSGDMEPVINKTGIHTRNFTVTNKVGNSKTLTAEVSGEIENFTEVNNGDNITLEADETRDVTVEFNLSYVEDYSGEIVLEDTSAMYNETIDIEIEAPQCGKRSGVLCLTGLSGEWMNVSRDSRGSTVRTVDVNYLGEKGTDESVDIDVTGKVSSYLAAEPVSFTVNETQTVAFNYTAIAPGSYTGTVNVSGEEGHVSFHTALDSDVEATNASISAPSSIDLGYFPSGETVSKVIEVRNTGRIEITSLEASSSTLDVSAEQVSIPAGQSRGVELTFGTVTADSGTVTLRGTTVADNTVAELSVVANPVPDYAAQADTLSSRITSLSQRATSDSVQTQLQSLETQVSQVKTAYQRGNYQEAQSQYQSIASQLDSVEQQIQQKSQDDGTGEQQENGGFPVLMVAVVLFVLLLVGFVAYTSIIPEEGDPLYNLLGG
ncbi:MAG: hypothetical protein ABEJ07_04830 [Candidatus Nanohaloarchaea archaeon]